MNRQQPKQRGNRAPAPTNDEVKTTENNFNFEKFWGHSKRRLSELPAGAYTDRPKKDDGMELDAAAIKQLYASTDLKGLQTACDEVGLAALDSFEKSSAKTSDDMSQETHDLVELALLLQSRILEVVVNEQHNFAANTYKISNLHRRVGLLWLLLDNNSNDKNNKNNVISTKKSTNSIISAKEDQASTDVDKAVQHLKTAAELAGDHDRHKGLHAMETIFLRHAPSKAKTPRKGSPARKTRTIYISSFDHTMTTDEGDDSDDDGEDEVVKGKGSSRASLVPAFSAFSAMRRKPETFGILLLGFAVGFLLALLVAYGLHAATSSNGQGRTTTARSMLSHSHHLGTIHSRRFGGYKKAYHYH